MAALGEAFRTARESQGLTLTEIADRIHIRSVYLAAIEAEDWTTIGPPVYVRGFMRTYARCLGLDPDAAVASFTALGPASTPVLAAPRGEPSRSGQPRGEITRRSGLSWGALAGVLVAIALVIFVAYQYYDYERTRTVGATADPVVAGASAAQPRSVSAGPSDLASVAAGNTPSTVRDAGKPADRSGFGVRLRDSSWVRVTIDGKVTMVGVYPRGTERLFPGRAATIRAGNAGAVDLSLNGKDLGPMGGLGDVAERSLQL
jgi:cytoskeletal protein RodZ